jgi:hypothetical protein
VKASGTGSKVRIELGSMYGYLGIVYEPCAPRGWRYEVLTDEEYPVQRWRGEWAERVVSGVGTGPSFPPSPSLNSDLTTEACGLPSHLG